MLSDVVIYPRGDELRARLHSHDRIHRGLVFFPFSFFFFKFLDRIARKLSLPYLVGGDALSKHSDLLFGAVDELVLVTPLEALLNAPVLPEGFHDFVEFL